MTDLTTAAPAVTPLDVPAHAQPAVHDHEGTLMLLHEALARSRQHEAEQAARDHALARSVTAGRRWELLARFAVRRAERARTGTTSGSHLRVDRLRSAV